MNAAEEIAMLKERVSVLERMLLRKRYARVPQVTDNNEELARDAVHFIARRLKMRPSDITGQCRQMRFVWARWLAIHLTHKNCRCNQSDLARLFERDHASIAHALRGVANEVEIDPVRRAEVLQLEAQFASLICAAPQTLAA